MDWQVEAFESGIVAQECYLMDDYARCLSRRTMKSKRALASSLRLAKLILSKTRRVSRSLDGRNKQMLSLGQAAMTLLEIFSVSEHTRPSGAS
jgi:hypothetical protein